MRGTIGVFVGSASSFNVRRAANNIGRALSRKFTVHLISTTETLTEDASHSYDGIVGPTETSSIVGAINALRTYITSKEPDALFQITQPPIHGTIVGTFAAVYDIPFVYRYSGDRFYEYNVSTGADKILHYGLNNIVGRIPLNFSEACITLGPTGKQRLVHRGVAENTVRIIPPIVNQEVFTPNGPKYEFETERSIGLFVGRLTRKKGKETLERTLPKILENRSDLQFVFVGEPHEDFEIPPSIEDHITLIGSVSPENVARYYRSASFLIHPSLSEGLPRSVLEATAVGIPAIARDVGDVSYVTDNVFSDDSEFIDLVCNFETLQANSIDRFTFDEVQPKYIKLLTDILELK